MVKISTCKFNKLWIEVIDRYDDEKELYLTIVDPNGQKLLANLCITEDDKNTKSKGDFLIYEYFQGEVKCLSHDLFINLYLDGNRKFGEEFLELLKARLNNLNRDFSGNETVDRFKKDGDKRLLALRNINTGLLLIMGVNLTKEYVEDLTKNLNEKYEPIKILVDDDKQFKVQRTTQSYPLCNICYITPNSEEKCNEIFTNFAQQLKLKGQKVNDPKGLKYYKNLYSEYIKFVNDYNNKARELRKFILDNTFNGTKIKKFEFRDDKDKATENEIINRDSELFNMLDVNRNYSKGCRYKEILENIFVATEDMKRWDNGTHWKNNTYHLHCPIPDISEIQVKGTQHTFIRGQDDYSKLGDFIKSNPTKDFYITYVDKSGVGYVEKTRLFYNVGLAEYKKGSSKRGYRIDKEWSRIDYFV